MTISVRTALACLALAHCGPTPAEPTGGPDTAGDATASGDGTADPSTTSDGDPTGGTTSSPPTTAPDPVGTATGDPTDTGDPPGPVVRDELDLVIVVDNSGSMAEEQKNLAANLPQLIADLRGLVDDRGEPRDLDVHIMVTTTDMDHPLCAPFHPAGYTPARGAPVVTPCTDRLPDFDGFSGKPVPEACTAHCDPDLAAAPTDPFIAFHGDEHNVVGGGVGDPVAQALACLGPQGIVGCGMEAPLEAMLQSLDPAAAWNLGPRPFLRPDAALALILLTDESDCSVKNVDFFDPQHKDDPFFNQFWEPNPDTQAKDQPTSAVCWNGGMTCDDADDDGVFEACVPEDKGVLLELERYTQFLVDTLVGEQRKPVVMLVIAGVPPVTAHNPEPPFQPLDGGVFDLVYRDWLPSDILPNDPKNPAQKHYEYGIGPGCTNAATGQAVPPGRILEVCRALDVPDDPDTPQSEAATRCCVESVCDDDFTGAIRCLTGLLTGG
jgi:hypothetical protein